MNPYESPKLLAEYLLLHYGTAEDNLGKFPGPTEAVGFPTRLVRELLAPVPPESHALDLGCAVGGSSFELARHCSQVTGIDYSAAFINAARQLQATREHSYAKPIEGDLTENALARVPAGLDCTRVTFEQGDATEFRSPPYEVLLAANLLCRLRDPAKFLAQLPDLVLPGGQLLLTTPFSWLEEWTPPAQWIGGTSATGRSFDALQTYLAPNFTLELHIEIPFLIREHARKFQYGIASGTRWRRNQNA